MESQPPEVQLKVLSGRVETLETRVTQHGREIDDLHDVLIRTEERDAFRDKQMASVESKVDRIDGKLDLISIQPAKENAEKWTKVTWLVISAVIGAVLAAVFAAIGLK